MGRLVRRAVALGVLSATCIAAVPALAADCGESGNNQDLFYNYYVAPNAGGVPAQLYLCPRPTPPLVGHTWITYQPLMPHEFLYVHRRQYNTYHGGGTNTTTKIRYSHCW